MKIDTLKIENFKSIGRLQIELNGGNAVISGQNGAGKTTILDAVCWLLSNRMSNGKTGESSNFNDAEKITAVEMTFDNGLSLRRNCNGKSVFFVNNVPCNATDFKIQVDGIFKGAVPAILTPFNFCRLHYNERRAILLKMFAPKFEMDMSDFAAIAEDLKKLSAEQIIKRETANKKALDRELADIPARINELSKLIFDASDIETLQAELSQNQAQYEKIIAASKEKMKLYNDAVSLETDSRKIMEQLSELRTEYRLNESDLEKLRRAFNENQKATLGTCPTCNQKIPAANLTEIKSVLADIVAQGKSLSETQEAIKQKAAELNRQLSEIQEKATQAKRRYNEVEAQSTTAQQLSQNRQQYETLTRKLQTAQQTAENNERIKELKAREIELGVAKSQCDKKIYLAEMYVRRKIEFLEQAINDQFQFVTFKMFEDFKTIDGVKECCEPYMNGVPYYALSKGEQLKASLDILQTLQAAYGVELPVFIDDAESYTSNSFVKLPNQIIRLIAAEGVTELKIDVDRAAAERKSA